MSISTRRLILVASLFLLPSSFQPLLAAESTVSALSVMEKINVNTADIKQLSKIKGLGSKKAQAIVDYRAEKGDFVSLSELSNVKGIGESTLKKISPYLSL